MGERVLEELLGALLAEIGRCRLWGFTCRLAGGLARRFACFGGHVFARIDHGAITTFRKLGDASDRRVGIVSDRGEGLIARFRRPRGAALGFLPPSPWGASRPQPRPSSALPPELRRIFPQPDLRPDLTAAA